MKTTINSRLIKTIKPQKKAYDIYDDKLTGFLIRVNPTGKMNYVCQYERGKRITISNVSVLTPIQAREEAREILSNVAKGIDPREAQTDKPQLLEDFILKHYKSWIEANKKRGSETINRIVSCFFDNFAQKKLSDIESLAIEKWQIRKLNSGRKKATINRDIVVLKAALSKAVEWGFLDENPLNKLKKFKVDKIGKVRYLNETEEKNIRQTLRHREMQLKQECFDSKGFLHYLTPMVLLSINTGLRKGELLNLTWNNVDLNRKVLRVQAEIAKSGRSRYIPLNSEALSVIKIWSQQGNNSGLVFPSPTGGVFQNINKAWQKLLEEANIENFRWHDLRHHFASKLVMAGVDLNTVRELLGHADIKMTLRYAHLAPEHKAAAVAKLIRKDSFCNDELF